MATILGLAMKISADATGVQQSLTPVERALAKLDDQAKTITTSFDRFAGSSSAAAAAQAKAAGDLERLTQQLQAGTISAPEYARAFEELGNAVDAEVASFERAARTIEANLSPLQLYDAEVRVLAQDLEAGRIDQETFDRAVSKATATFTKAETAAQGYSNAVEGAGKGNLQFNELSGILSALPGPLGNVAGRLSGLSSAGEGLSRVFGAGLSQGLTSIGASVAGLINPFTAAVAGVAAFGAAATAVARGLVNLEDRVERLSRLSTQLGVSFEFVQVLEEAGRRADVSIEQLSGSFARLQNTLAGADEESKKAQEALQRLGVSVQDFGALSEQQRIDLIGERLAAIEDPAQRSAAAIALFGRSGVQLLPFFNELPGAATGMERFGRAVSDLDRARLADFGGGLDALSLATQGLGQSLLLPFVGLGEGVTTAFAEITAGLTAVIDPIGQVLEPVLTQIGRVVELIGTGIGNLGRIIGAVFEPFATVVQAVSQAFEPLYETIFGFLEGISDAQVLVTEWLVSFTPIGLIADNVGVLGDAISRVVTIVTTAFSKVGEVIGSTLGVAVTFVTDTVSAFTEFTGLSGAIDAIGAVIGRVFGSVSSVFSTIANAIGGTVGRLLTMAENFLGIERSAEDASAGVNQITQSTQQLTEEQKKGYAEVQKAVAGSGKALDDAIAKAGEFGQAGFEAALEFENALADLKEQADNNELNAEQYSRGVALATAEFDKQVESLKKVQEETRKAAEEAQRRVDADRQVSDTLLEQARIAREFGGDNARAKAAEDALAVEREIARVREEVAAARDNGDADAVTNGETRIAQL
jgi:phage-related minor tail protein